MANVKGIDSGIGSPGDRNEYIEIYNPTDTTIILTKYILSDGDATDNIVVWNDTLGIINGIKDSLLLPKHYALILDAEYCDSGDGTNIMPYDIPDSCYIFTTANTTIGDGLSTTDPIFLIFGTDTVSTYGSPYDTTDNLPFDGGDGFSVERVNPFAEDKENMWKVKEGGTPGYENFNLITVPSLDSINYRMENDSIYLNLFFTFFEDGNFLFHYWLDTNWDGVCNNELSDSLILYNDSIQYIIKLPYISGYPVLRSQLGSIYLPSYGEMPLKINEIMYKNAQWGDYIEFYTPEESIIVENITINGVYIDSLVIYNYLVLCENKDSLIDWFGYIPTPVLDENFNTLSNRDSVIVFLGENKWVFDYSDFPDYDGIRSLERISIDADYKSYNSYRPSLSSYYGTPGRVNSIETQFKKTLISPNPFAPFPDGKDDFCRIFVDDSALIKCSVKIIDMEGRICYREIKRTTPFEFIWDGKREGNDSKRGRYLCIIEKEYYNGQKKTDKQIIYVKD